MMDRLPLFLVTTTPHHERVLLARLLVQPERLEHVRDVVAPDLFSDPTLRRVYSAILNSGSRDLVTLHGELSGGETEHAVRGWAFVLNALADDALDLIEADLYRRVDEGVSCAAA